MNDNEIYELISESFDDKVKLDFEDVKNRIAKLPDAKSAVITPAAPFIRKKAVFAVAVAAACLVCVFGISVAFSGGGLLDKSVETESYSAYDSMESTSAGADPGVMYSDSEDVTEDSVEWSANEAAEFGSIDESDCAAYSTVSESEISATDLVSDSDVQ